MEDDAILLADDLDVLLAVANQSAALAKVVAQGVADFVVQEFEKLLPRVDEVELAAEVAEHRGIFAADDAGAVDRDRFGRVAQAENRIAVEDSRMLEIHVRR